MFSQCNWYLGNRQNTPYSINVLHTKLNVCADYLSCPLVLHLLSILTQVFIGDNANKVSARLLGNIAQGRGSAIPLDTVHTF